MVSLSNPWWVGASAPSFDDATHDMLLSTDRTT